MPHKALFSHTTKQSAFCYTLYFFLAAFLSAGLAFSAAFLGAMAAFLTTFFALAARLGAAFFAGLFAPAFLTGLRAAGDFLCVIFLIAFFTAVIFAAATSTTLSFPSTISSPKTEKASPASAKKPFPSWAAVVGCVDFFALLIWLFFYEYTKNLSRNPFRPYFRAY